MSTATTAAAHTRRKYFCFRNLCRVEVADWPEGDTQTRYHYTIICICAILYYNITTYTDGVIKVFISYYYIHARIYTIITMTSVRPAVPELSLYGSRVPSQPPPPTCTLRVSSTILTIYMRTRYNNVNSYVPTSIYILYTYVYKYL